MSGLDVVIVWGNHFTYYAPQAALYTSHLHVICIHLSLKLHFFLFYSCFDGLDDIWGLLFILVELYLIVCNLPNHNIYI